MKHSNHQICSRPAKKDLLLLLLALVCLIVFISVSTGDPGGKEAFLKGKRDLEAGRYRDAVQNLLVAQKEFGILEDYSLLYLSEAYHNLGEHGSSEQALRALLDKYPSSVLRKKARLAEIRETADRNNELLPLYESYVRDYPEDSEAGLAYGLQLRGKGEKVRATAIFKKIYIRAGQSAQAAKAQLSADEITASDVVDRAANLIKQYDYDDAERELRQALEGSTGQNRHDIQKNLAYALFRQKKYREAAELYGQVNDLFFKARSLYRAGDKKGFEAALTAMTGRGDKRAGFLLLTVAADKRREKDFSRALQIYQDVLKNYPSDTEDALWGTGWTQYLSGDFRSSAETFAQLHGRYDDQRYLYWQARSMEAAGEDSSAVYTKIISADSNGFYAALAYARSRKMAPRLSSVNIQNQPQASSTGKSRISDRIEALISVDMKTEAVSELAASCRNTSSTSELIYSASKFSELGEFKRSITQALRIPYSEKVHSFWYPLAFWDKIRQASQRNDIDPYIVLSVMREESRFDHAVKSPAGAYGLMQLMPQTAYRLDRSLNLGIHRPSQLTDPGSNIQLGAFYLKSLFDEFRSLPHMLAAYNAGELAVRNWKQRFDYRSADEFIEDIPYNETRNYVKKVLTSYFQYKKGVLSGQGGDSSLELIIGKIS